MIALGERLHERLLTEREAFRTLGAAEQALVTDIAEMIIPETDVPGATTVRVAEFIDLIATEWMHEDERAAFLDGLSEIADKGFAEMTHSARVDLLTSLDAVRADESGAGHAFGRIKALTVYGYFTSQRVQQSLLKTQMYFDGYHGDVPFTPAS